MIKARRRFKRLHGQDMEDQFGQELGRDTLRNVVEPVTQINQIVPICNSDLIARRSTMAS